MASEPYRIPVRTPTEQYDIHIGSGILAEVGAYATALTPGRKAFLVSHPTLAELYGSTLSDTLRKAGFDVSTYLVPEGERSKTLSTASELYTHLAQHGADRQSLVCALGGGVIGDLSGFVAATYMRGIPLIQIPTSLLAMVDSSVGGKTAVNHELAFRAAAESGHPVVPVAISGTRHIFPAHTLLLRPGPVTLTIEPPLQPGPFRSLTPPHPTTFLPSIFNSKGSPILSPANLQRCSDSRRKIAFFSVHD